MKETNTHLLRFVGMQSARTATAVQVSSVGVYVGGSLRLLPMLPCLGP